jgi:hypothetical protein
MKKIFACIPISCRDRRAGGCPAGVDSNSLPAATDKSGAPIAAIGYLSGG